MYSTSTLNYNLKMLRSAWNGWEVTTCVLMPLPLLLLVLLSFPFPWRLEEFIRARVTYLIGDVLMVQMKLPFGGNISLLSAATIAAIVVFLLAAFELSDVSQTSEAKLLEAQRNFWWSFFVLCSWILLEERFVQEQRIQTLNRRINISTRRQDLPR